MDRLPCSVQKVVEQARRVACVSSGRRYALAKAAGQQIEVRKVHRAVVAPGGELVALEFPELRMTCRVMLQRTASGATEVVFQDELVSDLVPEADLVPASTVRRNGLRAERDLEFMTYSIDEALG